MKKEWVWLSCPCAERGKAKTQSREVSCLSLLRSGVPTRQAVHHDIEYFPVKMSLLHCACELSRICECVFLRTDLEELLYCSRIKMNENDMTFVKPISYLIYLLSLPCLNPRTNIFSSLFWGYNALWCKALSLGRVPLWISPAGDLKTHRTFGAYGLSAVFEGGMESICFQSNNSLLSGYGMHSSIGYR